MSITIKRYPPEFGGGVDTAKNQDGDFISVYPAGGCHICITGGVYYEFTPHQELCRVKTNGIEIRKEKGTCVITAPSGVTNDTLVSAYTTFTCFTDLKTVCLPELYKLI